MTGGLGIDWPLSYRATCDWFILMPVATPFWVRPRFRRHSESFMAPSFMSTPHSRQAGFMRKGISLAHRCVGRI